MTMLAVRILFSGRCEMKSSTLAKLDYLGILDTDGIYMQEELYRSVARVHRTACEAMAGSFAPQRKAALINRIASCY